MKILDVDFGVVRSRGRSDRPHSHGKEWEFHFFLDSHGRFVRRGKVHPTRPGLLFLSRPGEVHDTVNATSGRASLYYLKFLPGPEDRELLEQLEKALPAGGLEIRKEVRLVFEDLRRRCAHPDPRQGLSAGHLFLSFCWDLVSEGREFEHELLPPRIRNVIDHFHDLLPAKVTLAEAARIAGLDVRQLGRAFKAATGETPLRFYAGLKIALAKKILLSGRTSVRKVSDELGFCHPNHFSHAFSRRVGVSPRTWMKRRAG